MIADLKWVIQDEYDIPVDDTLRKDMSAMCNLSQGIRDDTLAEVIMTMHEKGYTSAQIAEIVKKTIEEVEAVIAKREPVLA